VTACSPLSATRGPTSTTPRGCRGRLSRGDRDWQQQNAKLWELRAATSLARLWRDEGKRTQAHELLAPVYDWFIEGFNTPVLQEAKTLLVELSDASGVGTAAV
jgi:predicted ATPase